MSSATDPRVAEFLDEVKVADALRVRQHWAQALGRYLAAITKAPRLAALHHNTAVCLYGLGRLDEATGYAGRAVELDDKFWQARLLYARLLRQTGKAVEAFAVLDAPGLEANEALATERASLSLHEFGDAATAGRLLEPFAGQGAADTALMRWMAALYDPGPLSAEEVSEGLRRYAVTQLASPPDDESAESAGLARGGRLRVGVISPQFRATPVFFFGIGVLTRLAERCDLLFFHRSSKEDWATPQFKSCAREWIDVSSLDPTELERELRRHALDVLIDMGGWMDAQALRTLARKPAKKMYKWVGGQAATTGLNAFDGFLGDAEQSPINLQPLYAEPLLLLDAGYVTYTPPHYFPAPAAADPGIVLGVIANPAKLSEAFLTCLAEKNRAWRRDGIEPVFRFIERRFAHARLQARVREVFRDEADIQFVAPDGHLAYLNEVARLTAVLDTFPYTGGLTTIEALMLGVPCRTRGGKLFCERHTLAHCRYAGMQAEAFELDGWYPSAASAAPRRSLIPQDSLRLQHERLAAELLAVMETH